MQENFPLHATQYKVFQENVKEHGKIEKQSQCQQCEVGYFMSWLCYVTLKFDSFTF